jgi:flagellar biosynthesis GTPase FlhF
VPTRVLLEGPAIEPLLAQVRDEYGSGVRIISADKVRSGGVGGFFAKQHYELSVEVPDPNEDRNDMAKRNLTENGHTLERLLERAESQDRMDEPA